MISNTHDLIGLPAVLSLGNMVPNPFKPAIVISFNVGPKGPVDLSIYDLNGHCLKTLISQEYEVGQYSPQWNGRNNKGAMMPTGVVPASGLTVTWDAGIDFPDIASNEISIRVHADLPAASLSDGYVLIPPSNYSMPITFTMGSTMEEYRPPHSVTITQRFKLAPTEVTNGQYVEALQWAYDNELILASPSYVWDNNVDGSTMRLIYLNVYEYDQINYSNHVFSTDFPDRPVVELRWYGAAAYCDWISLMEGLPRANNHSTWSCNNGDPLGATGYRLP